MSCLRALLDWDAPSHETIRAWTLRLGLFVLRRPLPRGDDWVFILDHTISLGNSKALLVVGVRLGALGQAGGGCPTFSPGRQDVAILDLSVTSKADGDHVRARLEAASARVGVPLLAISDHGSEMINGIGKFRKDHPGTAHVFDVSHRASLLVERTLEADPRWEEFLAGCSSCLAKVKQTAGAFLMPPSLRQRARYMDVEPHIRWAGQVLALLAGGGKDAAGGLGMAEEQAQAWVEQRLGWVAGFAADAERWSALMRMVRLVETEAKEHGLSRRSWERVRVPLAALLDKQRGLSEAHRGLREYLLVEGRKVPRGQSWPCSSDVVESLFGKHKEVSERGPFPEVGPSVLSLPAMTERWTGELVREALASVSMADVAAWLGENVGPSTLWKIRQAFKVPDPRQEPGGQDTFPA